MRVLQLIDSLDAGGAERVAVTFANALGDELDASYLCVTRDEGILKNILNTRVHYTFLHKRNVLDFRALFKLRRIIKKNKIIFIHAHTTSFFFATLLKLSLPRLKIIWHEHYGKRIDTRRSQNLILYFCSFFFTKIITVSEALQSWCKKKLATKDVEYLPNFIDINKFSDQVFERANTIVCVANLRPPKNHLNLLKAFKKVHSRFPDWKLQLIGNDFKDDYSDRLKNFIIHNGLSSTVDIYGISNQVTSLISRASIGVLSSDSEGLPMALLEYGMANLAVVCTRVGQCEELVKTFGKCVPSKNPEILAKAINYYIEHPDEMSKDAQNFNIHIYKNYSIKTIIPKLVSYYET